MLSFGVSLEDVFPEGEVHPNITNCLVQAYEVILEKSLTVEKVLRNQGTIQQRLVLKERVVNCRATSKLDADPGVSLWVVRHFIGLLPLPLLDEQNWIEIAKSCKVAFSLEIRHLNKDLIRRIADQLISLPVHNFLLTATLFDFLRKLAVLPIGEPRVNKMAAFGLSKYFSSAIFVKPFLPGSIQKLDKQFYPLTLFLIIKWHSIRKICMNSTSYRFVPSIEEIYPGFKKMEPLSPFPYYLNKKRADVASQTLSSSHARKELPEAEIDGNSSEVEIRVVPPSYDTCEFLQDVGCQTDFAQFRNKKNRAPISVDNEQKVLSSETKTRVVILKRNCCCTYGSHCKLKPNVEEDSHVVAGWISEEEESTGDDVETLLYDRIEVFDPVKKVDQNALLRMKASKIGWTYNTSDSKLNQNVASLPIVVQNIGWDVKDSSELDTIRVSLNKELKERFNKNQSEIDLPGREKIDSCLGREGTLSDITIESLCDSERMKGRGSVSKIKSRLDFLKIFNSKKGTSKSPSSERTDSKIKYEKMGSANSLL